LQNVILKKDTHTLDKSSKQDLTRHLYKFVKAFRTVSADNILKTKEIAHLYTINNKAQVRRATRPLVLGKGIVISYKRLIEEQANRVAEEAIE
jgi:hypothetical protein